MWAGSVKTEGVNAVASNDLRQRLRPPLFDRKKGSGDAEDSGERQEVWGWGIHGGGGGIRRSWAGSDAKRRWKLLLLQYREREIHEREENREREEKETERDEGARQFLADGSPTAPNGDGEEKASGGAPLLLNRDEASGYGGCHRLWVEAKRIRCYSAGACWFQSPVMDGNGGVRELGDEALKLERGGCGNEPRWLVGHGNREETEVAVARI
ncbi:hypothetical protein TRIUR3_11742 [Triticum urartu]|uniref:Uncharacterized protein n=1 Tax=Triticum urartu TaxID=4572 RepID=M7YY61_TRIUA|nr:hypothetical protein TRIUR3_11742 [Triticum urartu]